jgi:LysR family transcriptional activator of the allD operon
MIESQTPLYTSVVTVIWQVGNCRWVFAIAPDHPLAFMPEPISESQLRLYPNIMVEDTASTINKKVGWLLHGQEAILVPDFNTS